MENPIGTRDLPAALRHWLYDFASQGIVITDENLQILGWNQWVELHLGRPASSAVGKRLTDVFPDLAERKMLQWYSKALEGQVTILSHQFHKYLFPIRLEAQHSALDLMQQTARIAPLLSDGAIVGTLTMIEDVTERVVHERELHEKNALLQETVTALKESEAQLTRTNAELEQFAYVASHDLQEPLRKITGYVQLLRDNYRSKLDERADRYIDVVFDGAMRMADLIKDLLSYARIASDPARLTPIDLTKIARQVIADLEPLINEKKGDVVCGNLPTLSANNVQMQRLFQNLIGNALKFNKSEKPRVEISAKRDGQDWVISVSDNGIGIEPQNTERIFQIFQRLHGRADYSGTGIGLAVCKKIVERHGGKIWVDSVFASGSSFRFSLPLSSLTSDKSVADLPEKITA